MFFNDAKELLPNAHEERAVIQPGTHIRLDVLGMKFRQPAPVHRRPQMMRRVESVVEKEPVDEAPGDIAGMAINGIMITMLMLEQIDRDDPPLSEQPRQTEIKERCPPIQKHQHNDEHQNNKTLPLKAVIQFGLFLAPTQNVGRFVSMNQSDDDERKHNQV